jgi:hypothetical protein
VFIFADRGLFRTIFSDLEKIAIAQFIQQPLDPREINKNPLFNFLYRLQFSPKLNNLYSLPFKQCWNKKIFDYKFNSQFDNRLPYCFIVSARYYESYGDIMIDYLRHTFNDCKIICYFTDLVCNHPFTPKQKKHLFDAFFSFEKSDAERYGLVHFELPYSRLDIKAKEFTPKSDIFFIGNAKNRLKTIFSVYEQLANNGLKCDFYINDVNENDKIYTDKIIYNKVLEYREVVEYIYMTRCILEVLQIGEEGDAGGSPTLRPLEAVCYNKKLLTNCAEIIEKPYYNRKYISIFTDPKEIDIEFLKNRDDSVNYNYAEKLSPVEMVSKINKYIENGILFSYR